MPTKSIDHAISEPPVRDASGRIAEIDVLRGVALLGIVIIHHIEHFHVFRTPEHSPEWLRELDPMVMSAVFFMISGKAYALFSVLFGLSFYIQVDRRRQRGQGYFWRHVWRMALLFGFGMLHTVFFSGDILHMYAFIGVLLLLVSRVPRSVLLTLSLALIALPIHVASLVNAALTGSGFDFRMQGEGWAGIDDIMMSPSFWDDVKFNFGVLDEILIWNWNAGRVMLVPGLFFFGVFAGRARLLQRSTRWWCAVLYLAAGASLAFWAVKNHALAMFNLNELDQYFLYVFLETHHRTAFMVVYASAIVVAWKLGLWRRPLGMLAPFGRLGLTNYVFSSVLGSFLYFGWGLGLHEYLGSTITLLFGTVVLGVQVVLSWLWLKRFKQGPLEAVWRRLTWIGEARA